MAGWGESSEVGVSSLDLEVVELSYLDEERCIREIPSGFEDFFTNDTICASTTGRYFLHSYRTLSGEVGDDFRLVRVTISTNIRMMSINEFGCS